MPKITWKDRLSYAVDNAFSRGTWSMILWLALISLVIVFAAALILTLFGIRQETGASTMPFVEAFWESLMRTLDAGTMGGDTGWAYRLVMLLLPTLGGIFIISALIGVLSAGIEARLEELRRGRSRVIEQNHTVILGWTEQVFTIVSELIEANNSHRRNCIVILGLKDKVEMLEEIEKHIGKTGHTRIVCRTGSPMEPTDLALTSLETARSIIVLSPESPDPDSEVIKTILAITNQQDHAPQLYRIVAELRDPKNIEVAQVIGRGAVQWIYVADFIARVIAQTCRQSGLSAVYSDLLDFEGDEIHFTHQPVLERTTYGEALFSFEKNSLIGIRPGGQTPKLNPPMDTIIQPGDELIVIAEDDTKIALDGDPSFKEKHIQIEAPPLLNPERTLILGWNKQGPAIIRELDQYAAPESETLVVSDIEDIELRYHHCCEEAKNQKVRFAYGDTTRREVLDSLKPAHFDHVIVLSLSDQLTLQQADARTLVTLLHLRDIAEQKNAHYSVVSEMMDIRNRDLAVVTRADDFIVSDRLTSLMMAQVSENPHLNAVFADLFDAEGSEIYLKPVEHYVKVGKNINFYTIVAAARSREETAIGYQVKSKAHIAEENYGVVLNPIKSEPLHLEPGDRIIVLAEQ